MNNPFFKDFKQPFDTVPFNEYKTEDFIPAIKKAISISEENINAIAGNNQDASFENTILAFETASEDLDYITNLYWHLYGAESDADLKKLSEVEYSKLSK